MVKRKPKKAAEEKPKDAAGDFEKALEKKKEKAILRLYVTGTTPRSVRAIENIRKICEENFPGNYDLEVIDVYQQPSLLKGEQIVAVPTLIRKLPLPIRRFIGDLSDSEKVLLGLDLKKK
jgi:circadian clock protein KaiB